MATAIEWKCTTDNRRGTAGRCSKWGKYQQEATPHRPNVRLGSFVRRELDWLQVTRRIGR